MLKCVLVYGNETEEQISPAHLRSYRELDVFTYVSFDENDVDSKGILETPEKVSTNRMLVALFYRKNISFFYEL